MSDKKMPANQDSPLTPDQRAEIARPIEDAPPAHHRPTVEADGPKAEHAPAKDTEHVDAPTSGVQPTTAEPKKEPEAPAKAPAKADSPPPKNEEQTAPKKAPKKGTKRGKK